MSSHNTDYFEYLKTRSFKSEIYRRWFLYPRLQAELPGLCLDVGCGIGDFLSFSPNIQGIDINPEIVEFCKSQGLSCRKFDGVNIPFDSSSFDSLIMDNVLEHISDPTELIIDITRVLKQGGRFVVGVPGRKGYDADDDHKVFYTRENLSNLLKDYGFDEIKSFQMPIPGMSTVLRQHCVYSVFSLRS